MGFTFALFSPQDVGWQSSLYLGPCSFIVAEEVTYIISNHISIAKVSYMNTFDFRGCGMSNLPVPGKRPEI